MSGALNFTLGLGLGNFLQSTSKAQGALGGLVSMGSRLGPLLAAGAGLAGFGNGLQSIFKEINEGGRLFDLGKRLTEIPADLFKLEFAFDQVGASAASLGTVISQVNKSLGGVDESGAPTAEVFQSIGLQIEELSKLDAPSKLQAISAALNKLPKEQQFNLAAKIAGRGGAGELLAIAHSAEDFAAALAKAAPQAAIMGRNAAVFDRIGDSFKEFRGLSVRGLFMGIAEGAAPALQDLLNKLNSADLTGLGVRLGNVFAGVAESLHQSRFSEVFELSMKAGIQGGSTFMLTKIAEWSDEIRKAFIDPSNPNKMGFLETTGSWVAGAGPSGLAALGYQLGADAGIPGAQKSADFWGTRFQGWLDHFDERNSPFGNRGLLDGINPAGAGNPFADQLSKLLNELAETAKARTKEAANAAARAGGDDKAKNLNAVGDVLKASNFGTFLNKPDVNSLERVGGLFNMGRGGNPVADFTRRTADGVAKGNQLLERVAKRLEMRHDPTDQWANI